MIKKYTFLLNGYLHKSLLASGITYNYFYLNYWQLLGVSFFMVATNFEPQE